jgi:type II secretory ATPase GspE/PulE/Tfp pilus assembly ATPase PilB-like protein
MVQQKIAEANRQTSSIESALCALDSNATEYASQFVRLLLEAARKQRVSDVHLHPSEGGLDVRWRVDGVLQHVGTFPRITNTSVVTRLKVLAGLLTYRSDVPQEGRLSDSCSDVEMRISTFPTVFGERAVVRLLGGEQQFRRLDELVLPEDICRHLRDLLLETSGMILVVGPAGSGKTTTLYAALREVVEVSSGGRSIVSLEDPVEVILDGVAQSQISAAASFDFAVGLRSLMRQDPEVILVGEIRDRQTADVAFQAAMTGQLVLSSFHAGSAAEAITRLSDLGIAPYVLRSGLRAAIFQRLVRRLCDCSIPSDDEQDRLGFSARTVRKSVGCRACNGTGYRGRAVLAEMLSTNDRGLQQAILESADTERLAKLAEAAGMTSIWQRACDAVAAGTTSPREVRRVLGFGANNSHSGLPIL